LRLDDLVELHDEGVSEFLHDFQLPRDSYHISLLEDQGLLQNLDGNILTSGKMHCQLNLAKIALAKSLNKLIIL
jgi:hypothetical protein